MATMDMRCLLSSVLRGMHIKTIVRCHSIPTGMAVIKDRQEQVDKVVEKWMPHPLLARMQNGAAALENSLGIPEVV